MKCLQTCLISLSTNILFIFSAFATTVNLAVEDSWPPYATEDGRGYSREIVEEALKTQGYNVTLQTVPYARALHLTQEGLVNGCFNVSRQETTDSLYYFGKTPILSAEAHFFTAANSTLKAQSLDDLPDGFNIAVINGYEYGDIFEKNKKRFNVYALRTQKQIFEMLLRNRIDGFIMFDEVAKYTMKKYNFKDYMFKKLFLNHKSDIYVAFYKGLENKTEIADALDRGVQSLKNSGRYAAIFEKDIP